MTKKTGQKTDRTDNRAATEATIKRRYPPNLAKSTRIYIKYSSTGMVHFLNFLKVLIKC